MSHLNEMVDTHINQNITWILCNTNNAKLCFKIIRLVTKVLFEFNDRNLKSFYFRVELIFQFLYSQKFKFNQRFMTLQFSHKYSRHSVEFSLHYSVSVSVSEICVTHVYQHKTKNRLVDMRCIYFADSVIVYLLKSGIWT